MGFMHLKASFGSSWTLKSGPQVRAVAINSQLVRSTRLLGRLGLQAPMLLSATVSYIFFFYFHIYRAVVIMYLE